MGGARSHTAAGQQERYTCVGFAFFCLFVCLYTHNAMSLFHTVQTYLRLFQLFLKRHRFRQTTLGRFWFVGVLVKVLGSLHVAQEK